MARVPFRPLALAALAALAALVAACGGSPEPDTVVLGAQVAGDAEAVDVGPAQGPGVPVEPSAPEPDTVVPSAPEPSAPEPAPAPVAPSPDASADVLSLELTLEATEVRQGEAVRGVLRAENPTDQDVDVSHPSMCEIEQRLDQGGEHASEGYACAATMKPDRIGPHETRAWAVRIPTGTLPEGAYEALAGINLVTDRYAPPVSVTITAA